jgi:ABC-2 type transport system permease protein
MYSSANTEVINQLTLPMAVWSVSLCQVFQSVTRPPVAKVIEEEIKSGMIVYTISRPYSYILFHLLSSLGKMFPALISSLIIGSLVTWWLIGPIFVSFTAIFFSAIILLLGYILDFFIMFNIGLTAFWLEDISALYWNYFKLQFIFGGILIPVALFPRYLQTIAEFLPFSQLFYASSRLLVNFDLQLFYYFLSIQVTWIVILNVISYIRFRKALTYVSINGG